MLPLILSYPVAFDLFGIPVHWYGIIIAVGMLIAIEWITRELRLKGFPEDIGYDLVLWGIPIGFIGARIYYVIFEWSYYAAHPNEILQIWNGGIAIYGGVIAGALTLFVYCHKKHFHPFLMTDIVAPYLLLAQAIGRWGNFANQEAHGGPVSESFLRQMLHLPDFIVNRMQIDGVYYHPTFLYESLWSILGVIVIMWLRGRKQTLKVGETTLLYLIWYASGRFFIEGLRTDSLWWGPFRVSQVLSLLLVLFGVSAFIWSRTKRLDAQYYTDVHGPLPLVESR
ncbi:MAG: prolipoprotein diacylglyceryl transferase [Aerococcus sp.]|nr:prolipoprotein diacylglyceryl transferase [Aerococcus sp.]